MRAEELTITLFFDCSIIVIGRLYWAYKMCWNLKVPSLLRCPSKTEDSRAAPRPPGARARCGLRGPDRPGQDSLSHLRPVGAAVTREGQLRP